MGPNSIKKTKTNCKRLGMEIDTENDGKRRPPGKGPEGSAGRAGAPSNVLNISSSSLLVLNVLNVWLRSP